jgi:asparagine synthase (glutamine-hydrolysing)
MCGICGHLTLNKVDQAFIQKSQSLNALRGPDNSGIVNFGNGSFGHTRLSILDTTSFANQPFNKLTEYVMVYNGEIYNHNNLRAGSNHKYVSSGDTESIYYSIIEKGFDKTISMIDGMYAIAFYNKITNKINFARDRFGEKPLYYLIDEKEFYFSSSLRSFNQADFNDRALADWLKFGYCSSSQTLKEQVFAADPSMVYELDALTMKVEKKPKKIMTHNYIAKKLLTKEILLKKAEKVLESSVESRMLSDVPVCVMLSGGIDSSLISWKASELVEKLDTFSLVFDDQRFDEGNYSRFVSRELKTNHHEIIFNDEKLNENLESLISNIDNPIADQAFIPQYLLCKEVSTFAKVALSGDGADEIFLGYPKYQAEENRSQKLTRELVYKYSKYLSFIMKKIPLNIIDLNRISRKIENSNKYNSIKNLQLWSDHLIKLLLKKPIECKNLLIDDDFSDLQKWDIRNYLGRNILIKTDTTSMSHSLEVRSPFLSNDMVELQKEIELSEFSYLSENKLIWKILAKKRFGKEFAFRRKQGFSFPLDKLINTVLKEKISEILENLGQTKQNKIDLKVFSDILNSHTRTENYGVYVWSLVVLSNYIIEHND